MGHETRPPATEGPEKAEPRYHSCSPLPQLQPATLALKELSGTLSETLHSKMGGDSRGGVRAWRVEAKYLLHPALPLPLLHSSLKTNILQGS